VLSIILCDVILGFLCVCVCVCVVVSLPAGTNAFAWECVCFYIRVTGVAARRVPTFR
jgi:hypothetical protein